jgi:hypothetical protein
MPSGELVELRRPHDRVRQTRILDQLLLGDLRAQVAAVRQALRAHDGERDMVADAGLALGCEQVRG